MNNSMGKRSATAFKLKPTMTFAGQATVGAFVALAASGSVYAQGAAAAAPAASAASAASGSEVQQVVVSGIRRGIEAAISVKRNADQIVEAISAEDIGKLPDTTMAESLARLPGVTTQRDSTGNATNVSIRGLGPDFNGYLLNGREQTSTGDSRADDLSVYPVELMSGATVYKTADASLMTAGLAGTIDQKLIDPLMMPKRTFVVSGKKLETSRGLKGVKPGRGNEYSLNYVDQFADRTIGVAIGYVHKSVTSGSQGDSGWGDRSYNVTTTDGTQLTGVNVAGFGNGINASSTQNKDERNGLAAVLEFRPNDKWKSEVDFFHAKINTTNTTAQVQFDLGNVDNTITNATVDGSGHVTAGTIALGTQMLHGLIDANENVVDKDTLSSIGWRNELKLSDTWHAALDLSHNSAKRVERDIQYWANAAVPDTLTFTSDGNGNFTSLKMGNPSAYTDPAQLALRDTGWSGQPGVAQQGYDKGPTTLDKISAGRLDFTHDLPAGMFSALAFGGNVTTRTKDRTNVDAVIEASGADVTAAVPFPTGSHIVNDVGGTGIDMLAINPSTDLVPGTVLQSKFASDILSKTFNVREQVTTLYGKLDIDSQVGQVPVRGNIGLQYVRTNQRSGGYRADTPSGNGVSLSGPTTETFAGTTYSDVLPSLNLVGDLGDGNMLRFGAGIQLARDTLTDMRNSFTLSDDTTNHVLVGTGGNPYLKPFKAKTLDLSYEKYFANKEGYFSGALFYKHLDTYIISKTITGYDFTQAATALGVGPDTSTGSYLGSYTTTTNGSGGNLKGIELAAQLPFGMFTHYLDGFGLSGSWSDTTSSVKTPNTIGLNPTDSVPANGQISMPGLSHINKKLMMYFESHGFSAFVAENMRSRYIGNVANEGVGGFPRLMYIEPQKWVSAQVGYEVQDGWLKGLSARLEGNNLNKPVYRDSNPTNTKTGASYDLGVTYKF